MPHFGHLLFLKIDFWKKKVETQYVQNAPTARKHHLHSEKN